MKPIAFFSNSTIFADDSQDWFVLSPNGAGDDDSLDLGFDTLEQATAQAIRDGGRSISNEPSENVTFNGQMISDLEDNNYFGSDFTGDDENSQAEIRDAWTKQMVARGFFICNTYERDDFNANAQSALSAVINSLESN
jgi:hypothetical protein